MKFALSLAVLAFFTSNLAHAAKSESFRQPTQCSQLPKNQQNLFKLFNAYRESGSWDDALMYFGALDQYGRDFDQFVDPNSPAVSTMNGVQLFESLPAQLCTHTDKLEKKAKAGDPDAMLFILAYSAVSKGDDGASAEVLQEIQQILKTKYLVEVRRILSKNHSFFSKHRMVWL